MKAKTIYFFLVFFSIHLQIQSQELFVKNVEQLQTDTYASVNVKTDSNGDPCAVVKVSLPLSNVTFDGNIFGKVIRKGAEYILYMTSGSKKIRIEHPEYHSKEIIFSDYKISSLQSLNTYRITVDATTLNNSHKKQSLSIKVFPSNAIVQIDGEIVEDENIELPIGIHNYNVASKGYFSQNGSIEIKEQSPAKLVVELDKKKSDSNEKMSLQDQESTDAKSSPNDPLEKERIMIVNTFANMFDVELGVTTFDNVQNRFNGKRQKDSDGEGLCWVTKDGIEFKDCKEKGVVDLISIDPRKYKVDLPDYFNGISLQASYDEWNNWFVKKGFKPQPYDPYFAKQSMLIYGNGKISTILMFDGKPSQRNKLFSIIISIE